MDGRVLLVNMPFSGADRPQIGLGLLKAALTARSIPCDIQYFNNIFAQWIGAGLYHWFSSQIDHTQFAGEWVFAHHFFGDLLIDGNGYIRHLREELHTDEETIRRILSLRAFVAPFLDYCLQSVDWQRYSIIGFTSTFEQNFASLALAHAIKARYPNKIIVMGGANCEGPMGLALHRCFPFIDYVFSGEADESFPAFVERKLAHQPVEDIPGLVYRESGRSISTGPAQMITAMDSLPFPDYDDYFAQLQGSPLARELPIRLQIETSRGCWWGAKQHCTFCGLNAQSMAFRAKSKARALAEIIHLVSRYGVRQIAAVDNIMDMQYFRELLPELKERKMALSLFYEVKANLSREQVKLLNEAGVEMIQPGIESMNRNILKLMRKGITPLQNVQLLKWCKQYNVRPTWNLLYGFPGETEADYQEMLELLDKIIHLPPPDSQGSIRLDRFSPYFQNPAAFGLVNARPLTVYKYLYPFSDADLADLAYFYQYEYGNDMQPETYIGPTLQYLDKWRRTAHYGADLRAEFSSRSATGANGATPKLIINDTRPNGVIKPIALSGWQLELYLFCDQVRAFSAIERHLKTRAPEVTVEQLRAQLDEWLNWKITAKDGDNYLSLALTPTVTESAETAPPVNLYRLDKSGKSDNPGQLDKIAQIAKSEIAKSEPITVNL